jgi:hypothetical protein
MYSFVPPVTAGYKIMLLGNYRGLYNSTWIGTMVAMCAPLFALIGFYLVNYSVKRDIDTRVGQIITSGILTGGGKLFEAIFAIIMYCFLNKVPLFDFIGAITGSHELGIAHYLLAITFVLVILAFEGRKRQIRDI